MLQWDAEVWLESSVSGDTLRLSCFVCVVPATFPLLKGPMWLLEARPQSADTTLEGVEEESVYF